MEFARRPLRRALVLTLLIPFLAGLAPAAERQRVRVDDYVIDVDLTPRTHRMTAKARVKFTALDDISTAVFELHNGMRVTKVTEENGKALPAPERVTQDSSIRVSLPSGLAKGSSATLTFDYEGPLASADDSPVEGLKLAYIGEDTTYLLYAGRWFPITNYGIDRFTAAINITAPTGTVVVGSGSTGLARPTSGGKAVTSFNWQKPNVPGTIIAGPFTDNVFAGGGIHVYVLPDKKQFAPAYADYAGKELEFFSNLYGPGPSPLIKVVQIPDDTVPSTWAPEIAALSTRDITEKTNYGLLANTIAHQWWGGVV